MKKRLLILGAFLTVTMLFFLDKKEEVSFTPLKKGEKIKPNKKKTSEDRMLFAEERFLHEFNMQKNPVSGIIPLEEKRQEYDNALIAKEKNATSRTTSSTYTFRGPSNLGGRTRAFEFDRSDATNNTILAGGVSSGVFRTTDGGLNWTKVSANDEIHNVTDIVQDPRPGFQNIWYYSTGERIGNSANLGEFNYFGDGVWQSVDNGLTWTQIPETSSNFTSFDSRLDLISSIEVSPITGDLIIGATARIYRYDGITLSVELDQPSSSNTTDVAVTASGRFYVGFDGRDSQNGVWTSPTGNGSWTRIARNGSPSDWDSSGRIVLATAPSDINIVYALFANGQSGIEADLWQYNLLTDTWTDYSTKMPDEPGGDLAGNDPFAIQGGYDLVVSVKPDDENFVVIGGTNAYKIADITVDDEFERIGGYNDNTDYSLYQRGGDTHHPDIHTLEFDPSNSDILYSGTDGGVHRTNNVNATTVTWENINNDYRTYQYYHVNFENSRSTDVVIGGAQDNGTTVGGIDIGAPDNSTLSPLAGADGVAVGIGRVEADDELIFYLGFQNGTMFEVIASQGFRRIDPSTASSQFVTYFYLDPEDDDVIYYAGLTDLYRTTSAETVTRVNWNNLRNLPIPQNIRSMASTTTAYDPSTSYLLVGGQSGGVFRIDDPRNVSGLNSAVNITPSGASTASGTVVSGLAIHPSNPDIAMAVYANYGINNIYLTNDATSSNPSWTLVERNLSSHSIRSAAIVELAGETIYFVGTGRGLYSSNNPVDNDWEIEGSDQIGLAVVSSLVYRAVDNKLLVGTHGNGMFEATVEGTLSTENVSKGSLGLTLYPNPATSDLNLKISDNDLSKQIDYKISDVTGKLVMQGVTENRKVNVSQLDSGIYIINLMVDGKKQSSKFIKN
jgi:hypothetical protein